jgi:hypothetical protein
MPKCKSALEQFAGAKKAMLGGGYSVNVEDQIAGMATYNGYDDVNVHNVSNATAKKLVGGAKKSKKRTNKKSCKKYTKKRSSKKHSNSKKNTTACCKTCGWGCKTSKWLNKKKQQKGGCGNSIGDTFPFEGAMNDHSPDTMNKNYAGKQPNWGTNTR